MVAAAAGAEAPTRGADRLVIAGASAGTVFEWYHLDPYVGAHAPAGKRGLCTGWSQTTATFGRFLSLIVIILVRTRLGEDAFKAWGWRVPFLASAALLAVSLWIRLRLNESPVFQRMVA